MEQSVLPGLELHDLSEDVQQVQQVVIESSGPHRRVDVVQRGGCRASAWVLQPVTNLLPGT